MLLSIGGRDDAARGRGAPCQEAAEEGDRKQWVMMMT